jgi:hypothetical protein
VRYGVIIDGYYSKGVRSVLNWFFDLGQSVCNLRALRMEITMEKVFLGIFPPAGGTFESFDVEEFRRMIQHEETIPEELPEYEDGPPHRLFPSLQEVRKYQHTFPCHLEAWYCDSRTDVQEEARRYAIAQNGGGLVLLRDWSSASAFELKCHVFRHMRIRANHSTAFLVTATGTTEAGVTT